MSFASLEELSQSLYTMVQKTGALNSSKAEIKNIVTSCLLILFFIKLDGKVFHL